MVAITVLTPTYNRANNLLICYNSLLNQTNNDFEWIIVDDGSTDNTMTTINKIKKENRIRIKYFYKTNGGKHTALNYGINHISTDLTLILDSDDYLVKDAIEQIVFYFDKYRNNSKLCGYSFLKLSPDGFTNGMEFPVDEEISSFIDMRINRKISGDKCEVFLTRCLKEFPFPEFKGEKFIGESTVWIPMSTKYDMVHINKGIYVAEYLDGGLTKMGRKLRFSSPYGGMANSKVCMMKRCRLDYRIKAAILYNCYSFFAKKTITNIPFDSDHAFLTIFTMPIGYFLFIYWKRKYM